MKINLYGGLGRSFPPIKKGMRNNQYKNTMKEKKYYRQCLNCRKYIGWSLQPLKNQLEVCSILCQQKLNKKLDKQLNKRTETRTQSWQKMNQRDEEELIIFTEKQYQDLVNNTQLLVKGQNIHNSAKNISQLLMKVRK